MWVSALPDDTVMGMQSRADKGEVDELDQEDLNPVEDLVKVSSCSPEAHLNKDNCSSPTNATTATSTPSSTAAIKHVNTPLLRISPPHYTITPLFSSRHGTSPTTTPPHSPATSPSPSSTTSVAGPSSIPAQVLPHFKHRPLHQSGVIRSLTGNLTSAGCIAVEWATAINKYLQLMQSTTSGDSKDARKVLLGAKWALGQMYEARNDVRRDVLKVFTSFP